MTKHATIEMFAKRTLDNIEDSDPCRIIVLAWTLDMFFITGTHNDATSLNH